mmetsp:Transcript_17544/g.30709  ORF Transcript_17544/g.30709 Transcript_17544/m.30709 type:complete len:167 (+) Transcript_17544:36-536(+)
MVVGSYEVSGNAPVKHGAVLAPFVWEPWIQPALEAMLSWALWCILAKFSMMLGSKPLPSSWASCISAIGSLTTTSIACICGNETVNRRNLAWQILALLMAGVCNAIAVMRFQKAMTVGPAGPVVALSHTYIAVTSVAGVLLFREVLTASKAMGVALVLFGGYLLAQ